jgi:hypothetical protein
MTSLTPCAQRCAELMEPMPGRARSLTSSVASPARLASAPTDRSASPARSRLGLPLTQKTVPRARARSPSTPDVTIEGSVKSFDVCVRTPDLVSQSKPDVRLLPREIERLALIRLGPASAPRQRGWWKRHRARPSRVPSIIAACGPRFCEESWSSRRDACDRRLLPITLRRAPDTYRRPPCGFVRSKLPSISRSALHASRRGVWAGAWRASRRPTRFRALGEVGVGVVCRARTDDQRSRLVISSSSFGANRRVALFVRWAAFRDGPLLDRASMALRPS